MTVDGKYIPSTEAVKFIAKAKDKYGDRYNYDKVEYLHSKSKVIITCPEHGDFMQSPNQHLKKRSTGLKRSSVTRAKIQKAHKERSAKHWKFEAWWYEVDGVKTEVFDKTIRQFAEEMEVNFDIVKDRFRSKFIGKELTRGPLKGYKFGRIKDGK